MATAAASLHGHTVLPPEDPAGYQRLVALLAASDAAGGRTSGGSVFELTIRPATGGAPVAAAVIPPELFEVLIEVIDAMARRPGRNNQSAVTSPDHPRGRGPARSEPPDSGETA